MLNTNESPRRQAPNVLVVVDLTGTLINPNERSFQIRAVSAWLAGGMRLNRRIMSKAAKLMSQLPIGAVLAHEELPPSFSWSNPGRTERAFDYLMGGAKFSENESVIKAIRDLDETDGVEVVALSNMPSGALKRLLTRAHLPNIKAFSTNDVAEQLATIPSAGAADAKAVGFEVMLDTLFSELPSAVVVVENDMKAIGGLSSKAAELDIPFHAICLAREPAATNDNPSLTITNPAKLPVVLTSVVESMTDRGPETEVVLG